MCDSCCREISSYATCCPHCGHDTEGSSDGGGIWGGFFMGILQVISWILQVIIIAVGCIILYLDTFLLENDYWHLEFIF